MGSKNISNGIDRITGDDVTRVGFTLIGGSDWTGGRNYLVNLLRALSRYERQRIEAVLFVGLDVEAADLAEIRALPGVVVVVGGGWNGARRSRALVNALLFGRDRDIERDLKAQAIDVFFECARFIGRKTAVATIAWIPDLQHRLMRDFFPLSQWWKRELGIRAQQQGRRLMMFSSDSARRDYRSSYPTGADEGRVVRFSTPRADGVSLDQAHKIAASYGLPDGYFFLPNQFWRHKNHAVVIDALALLKRSGIDGVVAATGKAVDPRAPGYFETLMDRVRREGLVDRFRYLGMVPYEHLTALLRGAKALLNPSLFEGWSTTVEEARSQGVPMLLSDIPVHREQMGDGAEYFDPRNPESLAATLKAFPMRRIESKQVDVGVLSDRAERAYRAFAQDFADTCEEALTVFCRRRRGESA